MTTRTSLDVNDAQYRASHWHAPRGRGTWAFHVMDASSMPARVHDTFFTPSMKFTDAKVWAKAYVRKNYAAELKTGNLYLEVGA